MVDVSCVSKSLLKKTFRKTRTKRDCSKHVAERDAIHLTKKGLYVSSELGIQED